MNVRAASVVAVLLVIALVAAPALRRCAATHRHRDATAGPPAVRMALGAATEITNDMHGANSEPLAKLPDVPSGDLIGRDGAAAAELWHARALSVMFAKNRKEYGDEVARLMQLPYDESWGPLRDLADDGDTGAAHALAIVAMICSAEEKQLGQRATTAPGPSRYYKDLSGSWKLFVDRLAQIEHADHAERASHCSGIGDKFDFMSLLLDKFLQSDHPDILAEMVADNADAKQAIADLRELIAKGAGPHTGFVLGDRLLRQRDPAQQAEGRAMLERLAADDPTVASRLAYCLSKGCDGFAPQPGDALPWLEMAAGGGDLSASLLLTEKFDADGAVVDAWAWSLYTLDLALAGCYEVISPTYIAVASAGDKESRRRAQLSPPQQNAGLATFYEISGRWEQGTKQRLACAN